MAETLDERIARLDTEIGLVRAARIAQLTQNTTSVQFEGRSITRPSLATLDHEEQRLSVQYNQALAQKHGLNYTVGQTIEVKDDRISNEN